MILRNLKNKYGARKEDSEFALHFLDVYEDFFSSIRHQPMNILEIGVQKGGSVKMWAEYFSNSRITGVDISKKCLNHASDRINIILGDQADEAFLQTLGNFDIIIDDGGHTMEQQKTSFSVLWHHINPGGFYVLEDLETSYWPAFGGALNSPITTIEFLKSLVDNINHIAVNHPRAENKRQIITDYGISSMCFYKSLCVLEKTK